MESNVDVLMKNETIVDDVQCNCRLMETEMGQEASVPLSTIIEESPQNHAIQIHPLGLSGRRALLVAASARRTPRGAQFVKKLVVEMEEAQLELKDNSGNTALCLAAINGNLEVVKIMVAKHKALLSMPDWEGMMPLCKDALSGRYDVKCVEGDMFDIAPQILTEHIELANDEELLRILARKPDAFVKKSSNFLWKTVIWVFAFVCPKEGHPKKDTEALQLLKMIIKDMINRDDRLSNANLEQQPHPPELIADYAKIEAPISSDIVFIAAEMGNTKFIVELIITDKDGNNMVHLVGKIEKAKRLQDVLGVLQMHVDVLWLEEVESMIPSPVRECKNNFDQTPRKLFWKEHKNEAAKCEEWMKGTASHCMVVATFIATIAFTAAFTVPGGYHQTNGIPIFTAKPLFMVFIVSDAISFFSSTTSILMFLSVLISHYAERDFLKSSPKNLMLWKNLMLGLATLLLSITTMTIAFSVSFFVLYYNHFRWVPILISLFGVIPVFLFAGLICPLMEDIYRSTYASTYLFGPNRNHS
ncbi:ankyrin repeat-containing domain, PGG domain protein [Tanacetum coccineum]